MESTNVYKKFVTALEQQNHNGLQQKLCVALSGGVDSVVLLHLCHQYAKLNGTVKLQAIYVNHGLSDNALMWQQFCTQLCAKLAVPFRAVSVDIQAKSRTSLEAQARDARYLALDTHASEGAVLVLGQHADDQIETFLIRLKRGSGLQGLGAMRAKTQLASGRDCIRPLLGIERKDIEAFAQTFSLTHIEDESNHSDVFDRNFLRNQVIPLLKSRFSGFVPSVLRSISLLQAQQALVDEISQSDLESCSDNEQLDIVRLATLSALRQSNVVRAWFAKQGVSMPSQKQLAQIIDQAINGREDAQVNIELRTGSVKRYNALLYWVPKNHIELADIENISLTAEMKLADGRTLLTISSEGVRKPLAAESVAIRFGRLNDKIKPFGKPGRNTVKHWLKEARVPSWERTRIPMVYYNETLIAVAGYFINSDYAEKSGINWQIQDAE
ncbi:tRNA lysidine(34) synthetase TilS [Pseudoalteromonas sp. Of7M-16]|uniref:tRNA lysidine(34) synthetase TilS n=1 Tax=Pseudoalteromonas sp. Of7M-16 TaxID=2917756 RepID=UPI001EF41148|nr:tRNA lysidine(34) synthetase TilS [Pseudoalteromonas sp. Of7M-16]MCG7549784.1 tRNA lysidine(34) synthetase TilS [Pseudoalteromonas sp. Of7M-16]